MQICHWWFLAAGLAQYGSLWTSQQAGSYPQLSREGSTQRSLFLENFLGFKTVSMELRVNQYFLSSSSASYSTFTTTMTSGTFCRPPPSSWTSWCCSPSMTTCISSPGSRFQSSSGLTSPQSLMILAAFDENIHTEILALVLVSTAFAWQTSTVAILLGWHPSHHHQKSSTRESEL